MTKTFKDCASLIMTLQLKYRLNTRFISHISLWFQVSQWATVIFEHLICFKIQLDLVNFYSRKWNQLYQMVILSQLILIIYSYVNQLNRYLQDGAVNTMQSLVKTTKFNLNYWYEVNFWTEPIKHSIGCRKNRWVNNIEI